MIQSNKDDNVFSVGLALFVVFLWATSWVLIKLGLNEIPALTFAGLRYFIAFAILLPFFWASGGYSQLRGLDRNQLSKLVALGILLYSATQGAQFVALDFMPAVTVNLLWSFSPVAVAMLGKWCLEEKPTGLQIGGIGLALIGAVIFFYPARFLGLYVVGLIASAVGVVANAGASVLGRELNRTRDLPPLLVTVISMGIGSAGLLAVGLITQGFPRISGQGWLIVMWLAVVNTALAFTLWNRSLQNLSAAESSVINGTMIIWIPILAVLFLDEVLSFRGVIGLVITGIGTILVQLKYTRQIRRLLAWAHS